MKDIRHSRRSTTSKNCVKVVRGYADIGPILITDSTMQGVGHSGRSPATHNGMKVIRCPNNIRLILIGDGLVQNIRGFRSRGGLCENPGR
jgi:hypothetical protein